MKTLFDSAQLAKMALKNRFIRSATWEELAKGGVGAIITGNAFVMESEQHNPGMLGIYDDSFINEYKRLTDKVHEYGVKIIMQIVYGGSQTSFNVGERTIWGPSSLEHPATKTESKEISKEEIKILVQAFADAAARAKKAGFDGVQLHAAHGLLFSQFLNPYYNRRTDEYGGSIDNRARILLESYEAMRKTVGEDYPILVKIHCEDFMEGGLSAEDSLNVCRLLSEMGIDAIEVSGGDPARTNIPAKEKESYFKEHAAGIAEQVKAPILLVGGNRSLETMSEILDSTKIEFFSLSRPLLREPDLINRWQKGDTKKAKCISCNKCFTTEGSRHCIFNM